jgi:hypothetical protein
MKKIHRFIMGGIIIVALSKMLFSRYQSFDIADLISLIFIGGVVGYIGFIISEMVGKKKADKK